MDDHRKLIERYDDPGHFLELTFSCCRRLPLLINDAWRAMLSKCVDRATTRHGFGLVAFVFMPEHVHLLVMPIASSGTVSSLLKALEKPFLHRIRVLLDESALHCGID